VQIFVDVADLATDPVPILCYYPDTPVQPKNTHGAGATVMTMPFTAIVLPPPPTYSVEGLKNPSPPPLLVSTWRADNMPMIVNGEANRRIQLVFPDFMQRNANADINRSLTLYGPDSSTWPSDAQDRKAQNDLGWAYVGNVRQTSDALASNLTMTDPTNDTHWPVAPPPIYIPPIP
jgi:hypothetical protein